MKNNILKLENRAPFKRDDGINTNRAVCYIITKDNKRLTLELMRWDRRFWRHTNKRTGQPLKKPIIEKIVNNSLSLHYYYNYIEIWEDGGIYEGQHGQSNEKYREDIKNEYLFNYNDMLKAINKLSKINYDSIELLDIHEDAPKPEGWEELKEQEKREAISEYITNKLHKIAEDVEDLERLEGNARHLGLYNHIKNSIKEKTKKLGEISGATNTDIKKIKELIKQTGGHRERDILKAKYKAIIKEYETQDHNIYTIYNLKYNNNVLDCVSVDVKTKLFV